MMENEMMNNNNSNILHHQLPWGLTFNPTDEDLMRYLRAKVDNIQLPFVDPILEFDVFTVDHPSQLFYLHQEVMNETHVYYYVKKSGKVRSAGNGRWIASNGPVNIFSSEGEMMGERRSLVYYNSKEKIPAKKTRWIMNEYRLPNLQPTIMSESSSKDPFWTLCKIGETGRTSGDNEQVLPPPRPQPHQMLQQVDNVELVPQEVTGRSFGGKDYQSSNNVPSQQQQQQQRQSECDDDGDQGWIDNLESTLEVDGEEQQPQVHKIDDQQLLMGPHHDQQVDDQQQQHQQQPLFEQHQPQVLQQHTDNNIINVEDYNDISPCLCLDEYQGNFDSWMETIKKRGNDDQQQQFDDEEEDDQDWIENLESTLEVDDEEQQPLQQLPLIHQPLFEQHQPKVLQQHSDDNIITVEDYDDIPPCIFLDEYQCNFDSWMETIKKRGHDDQQQQVYDEEEPSPKRAKA